jgi:hypothetical protein
MPAPNQCEIKLPGKLPARLTQELTHPRIESQIPQAFYFGGAV